MTPNNSNPKAKGVTNTPTIHPMWKNLLFRAQSATRNHDGVAFIQLQVIVKDGIPLFWAEPKVVKMEPKLDISLEMLLGHMDQDDLANVLRAIMS